jgi:hypothetical protein
VRVGAANELVLRPPALPTCRVRVPELPDDVGVLLGTAAHRRGITAQVRSGAPVGLPDEPCWLVLASGHTRRAFAVDRAAALRDGDVRVEWFAPTRVEGVLVDRAGAPVAAALALHPVGHHVPDGAGEPPAGATKVETAGQFSLATTHVGLALLAIHGPPPCVRHLPVLLPPRADGAVVDLGTITVDDESRLELLDADGSALRGDVGLVRPGWHDVRQPAPRFLVDARGRWYGPPPRAGDAIEVRARDRDAGVEAGAAPRVRELRVLLPLSGDGPWTLRVPAGEVLLDVRDDAGAAVRATVFAGDDAFDVDGPVVLRRLRPGPQRLFVAAEDRQSAIVELTVPASDRVDVRVALPPR